MPGSGPIERRLRAVYSQMGAPVRGAHRGVQAHTPARRCDTAAHETAVTIQDATTRDAGIAAHHLVATPPPRNPATPPPRHPASSPT